MSNDELIFAEHAWSSRGERRLLMYDSWPIPQDNFSREGIRRILKQYGAWGAIWSYDWDCGQEGPWYWIVCDDPEYDLDKFKSRNTRKLIRRGLKRTQVRRVEPEWLARNGYQTYFQALSRYTAHNVWPRSMPARRGAVSCKTENTRSRPAIRATWKAAETAIQA